MNGTPTGPLQQARRALRDELALWARAWSGAGGALRRLHRIPRATLDQAMKDPRTLLILMVALFAIAFSLVGGVRYFSFQTYAWDLGIYNQASYTTLFAHRFFYYTADLPAGTEGSLFAVHFSPFLFLLLPFYALAPQPTTLLAVQAAGVAAAAFPLYGIARDRLGSSRLGLGLAAVYLLSPVTQGLTWYDFHPEAFLPVTVLGALYFLHVRRPLPFFGAWVLALSIVETIAPFLVLFCVFGLWTTLVRPKDELSAHAVETRRWLLWALVIALGWVALSEAALAGNRTTLGGAFGPNYGVNWSILGAPTALWVYPTALLHPANAFFALSYDTPAKLLYLAILFGPLLFLPWLGEDRCLFPALAWVGMALLSNSPGYYQIADQYSAYAWPFLLAGSVGGLSHLREHALRRGQAIPAFRRARERGWFPRQLFRPRLPVWLRSASSFTVVALLGATLVGSAVASPLLSSPVGTFAEITYGLPSVTAHDRAVHRLIDLVPPTAAILTTSTIFPELSGRVHAYVLPSSSYFAGNAQFSQAVDGFVNASQFVLVDYVGDPYSAVILSSFANLTEFGPRAVADGAYLFERGWTASAEFFQAWGPPVSRPSDLALGNAVLDPTVSGPQGPALHHLAGTANGSLLWSGLDLYPLPPGVYRVSLELRTQGGGGNPVLGVSVLRTPITVRVNLVNPSASGHDYGFEEIETPPAVYGANATLISAPPPSDVTWENLSLEMNWSAPGVLDCQGWALSSLAQIWLYAISVDQIAPLPDLGAPGGPPPT